MNDKEPLTSLASSRNSVPNDSIKTVISPNFNSEALQHARPAVPLSAVRSRRFWPLTLAIIAVLAGLIGGVIGGFLAAGYRQNPTQSTGQSALKLEDVGTGDPATGNAHRQTSIEAAVDAQDSLSAGEADDANQDQSPEPQDKIDVDAPAEDHSKTAASEPVAALREAFNAWLDATNSRDIGKQMSFYNQKIESFYRARNVTSADVRSDKARAFENAHSIKVGADSPQVSLGPEGHTAVMRFRKRYAIAGGGEDRRGVVVQELRWRLVGGKWKIISERDILVVR